MQHLVLTRQVLARVLIYRIYASYNFSVKDEQVPLIRFRLCPQDKQCRSQPKNFGGWQNV